MKNQYFGDNRDLFKHDLVYRISQAGLVDYFTFIPTLTENDDTEQGGERNRDKAKAGRKNDKLVKFLGRFKEKSKRDIKHLKNFFSKQDIEMTIYYGKSKYFPHLQRGKYFKQIENELPLKSLIFVDPDIGLEIKSKKSNKKHIRYSEVKDLYERIDKNSILMVYQHHPRIRTQNNIREHFSQRSEKLREITGELPIYIDDNEMRFFFLTKGKSIRNSLGKILRGYKNIYPRLTT